jgi:hypothetical protein
MDESSIRALFAGVTSGWDSHRPVLCEAVLRTQGLILELGTGEGSTPALHEVATGCGRHVFSFDHDPQWIDRFVRLRHPHHYVARVASWDNCPIESAFWSVGFVDHAPGERRVADIQRLAYRAELVVVHDTEDPAYGYEPAFRTFAHRFDYRKYQQWTSVVSNYVDVSHWCIGD